MEMRRMGAVAGVAGVLAVMVAASACSAEGRGVQEESGLRVDPDLEARLEPLLARAMERDPGFGLQVAVVTADGTGWTGAFGLADSDTGRPVTDETRFYLASTTKALTALAAARLAHRGELDLDASLADAFPAGTRFHPEYDASTATVRDLLTHTHGLQQGAISFRIAFTGELTNDEFLALLERHPPRPDRDFRYANFSYDMVGLLLAPDTERGWKAVVEREVLEPLGMKHTTARRSEIPDSMIAMPHDVASTGVQRIRLAKDDANLGPAGGHFSTATDLARLLLVELNEGRLDGRQIIPAEVIAETQRPQVPQERTFLHYDRHAWGLGWDIGIVDGDTVIHRPGGFSGYYSNAAFLPDHGFGVVVLANGGGLGARLAEALAAAIYDEMRGRTGGEERLDAALDALEATRDERAERLAALWAGVEEERLDEPVRPLASYVGVYSHELWGDVQIVEEDGGLVYRSGMMESRLVPVDREGDGDAFFGQIIDSDDQVTFLFDGDGPADGPASGLRLRGTDDVLTRRGR